jgi:hypothetical protein
VVQTHSVDIEPAEEAEIVHNGIVSPGGTVDSHAEPESPGAGSEGDLVQRDS